MPSSKVRYVNRDSSAGGNGTTNATSGANRAYSSFVEMEAAEQYNLVTADEVFTCYFTGGASPSEAAAIAVSGWTPDATRYMIFQNEAGEYHGGKKNANTYHVTCTSTNANGLSISESWVRLIGLGFKTDCTRANYASCLELRADFSNVAEIFVEKCVFWQNEATPAYYRNGIELATDDVKLRIQNCFFFDFDHFVSGELAGAGIHCNAAVTLPDKGFIQHNTFHNCGYAVYGRHASAVFTNVRLRNNVFSAMTQADLRIKAGSGWHAGSDYNVTTRADGSGETDVPGSNSKFSQTLTFTDSSNGDCHTTDTDVLVANNLYSDADYTCTEDIDAGARTSSGDAAAGIDHVTASAAVSRAATTMMMGV